MSKCKHEPAVAGPQVDGGNATVGTLNEASRARRSFFGQVGRWSAALTIVGLGAEAVMQGFSKRSIMASAVAGAPRPNLLFASNFEGDVQFGTPRCGGGTACFQGLEGYDPTTGFDWADFSILNAGYYGHLITGISGMAGGNIGEYHDNGVRETVGRQGMLTRAANFRIIKNDNGNNQNIFGYYANESTYPEQLYCRYWLRLEDNFAEMMGPNSWMSFWGWKALGDDYRLSCQVLLGDDGVPFWYIRGDSPPRGETYFSRSNKDVPVPQGEWFEVEWFYTREGRGRVWWAVNGTVLFDYMPPEGESLYGVDQRRLRQGTFHSIRAKVPRTRDVWLDEFEVWDNFPSASSGSTFPPQSPAVIEVTERPRYKGTG